MESSKRVNDCPIERCIDRFMEKLPELLKEHEGKWVAMDESGNAEVRACYEDALDAGYKQYGLNAFLVRNVCAEYKLFGRHGMPQGRNAAQYLEFLNSPVGRAHQREIQEELYRRAYLETNGDDRYYEALGEEAERHPIVSAGIRGSRCTGL